jgi:hypothetical protein
MPILAAVAAAGLSLSAAAAPPAALPGDLDELARLLDRNEHSAIDLARGGFLAARVLAAGPPALPLVRPRFERAATPGEAAIPGLFLAVHGTPQHRDLVQRELERSCLKRSWLSAMVGSEARFAESVEEGRAWQPLLRVLPSLGGVRALTLQLAGSRDALVRRSGLYWGFWIADDAYWSAVRQSSARDPDPATRRIASWLLRHAPAEPGPAG